MPYIFHFSVFHFPSTAAALPQTPPAPIGPVFTEALSNLIPAEVSLETFNSQYLQRHSTDGKAVLAAARVLRRLEAPLAEVESVLFGLFAQDVQLEIHVRLRSFFPAAS
jgi:hypothetical protein